MGTNKLQNYIFRDYLPSDFSNVLKLWQQTGITGKIREDDAETIEKTISLGGKLIILEDLKDKILIGTSWMTFDGRRIHLHHFGISPEFQNKGYGKLLLEESLKFARDEDVQIKLEVHKTNIAAIKLYEKYGFKYLGDFNVYIIRDLKTLVFGS